MPTTPSLPIDSVLAEIRSCLQQHKNLVLQAPPGAGKTTRVPLALLDQPWLAGRSIVLLEPRRLAARAAAARMAAVLNEEIGATVGYRIRFEHKISRRTRIEVVTEGILTRRLQHDPALQDVGLVIFDEYHERSLHADLALALCLESQAALRDDLRVLVMSATLDGDAVAGLLGDAPIVTASGRSHPVEVHYLERDSQTEPALLTTRTITRVLADPGRQAFGDMLVFLPGAGDIRRTQELLRDALAGDDLLVVPLYGDLPFTEQQRALLADPRGRRKIVLATPIAETSLTIEGVGIVIDSGWMRLPCFDPRSGLSRLRTVRISADSAEQRAGRAGRLGPGICYRLWSEAAQRRLAPQRSAEIEQADLAPLALELAQWGVHDAGQLSWLTPPPAGALAQARALLVDLGALDEQHRISEAGRRLAELPLHPRLAHMIRAGGELGLSGLACDLAALLEERDILRAQRRSSDITLRLQALRRFRRHGREAARALDADPAGCARADRAARQWQRRLNSPLNKENEKAFDDADVGLLLALAYPDRIAKRRADGMHRYQLANGRGARLSDDDTLPGQDWLVVAQIDAGDSEGKIFLAAKLDRQALERLPGAHIRLRRRIEWDTEQEAVIALEQRCLGQLVIDSRPLNQPDPQRITQAMLDGIRRLGLDCLPWDDKLRQWQARVMSLRQWLAEDDWPDVGDATLLRTLDDWLGPYLNGIGRRGHLRRLDLAGILRSRLDWSRQKRLDELAPTHLQVPGGSRLRLRYTPGEPPLLAVKLQEMFGLTDTPRIAGGRIAVMLHLLSPAQRPVQITRDLAGFWHNTYPEVKKELKGRYPKHPWPDDPGSAVPTRHTTKRFNQLNRR
jgi:ATP-dependent helicase HrpB